MKKILFTLCSLILVSNSILAQLKIRDKSFKPEKVKGIITLMNKAEYTSKEDPSNEKFAIFGTATVAGILIPYAIKYGNSALKSAASKKPEDYIFETEALNPQVIDFDKLGKHVASIKVENIFYKNGESDRNELAEYEFSFYKKNNLLKIKLSQNNETYTPVKIKKKYDLILSNFDISISASTVQTLENGILQEKIVDLGTVTINKINPGFLSNLSEVLNETQILLPSKTEKGKNIDIRQLIVKLKIKHLNPYGTTNSYLNEFLEKNSETNESLLNTIFVNKEDGE
jgi:hypothetical protein